MLAALISKKYFDVPNVCLYCKPPQDLKGFGGCPEQAIFFLMYIYHCFFLKMKTKKISYH
jgi:hypothetical protein